MFYGDRVQDTRKLFFSSWEKYRNKQSLLPLEKQIVDVILTHPEYHNLLVPLKTDPEKAYFPEVGESNPFLHMGLHLAIQDQIATNRPLGIAEIYFQLIKKHADVLMVEHLLMAPLVECLWQAQRENHAPDEVNYLRMCQQLLVN